MDMVCAGDGGVKAPLSSIVDAARTQASVEYHEFSSIPKKHFMPFDWLSSEELGSGLTGTTRTLTRTPNNTTP
jgi:hypothetical protein